MSVKALVVGAGIGGLSAALALEQAGADVTVFEDAEALRVTGAGLNVWPNGVRVLNDLGLEEPYEQISSRIDKYLTLAADGTLLEEKSVVDWDQKYGAPVTGVHRRSLSLLIAESFGMERIQFGHRLERVSGDADSVACYFANGKRVTGDLLVGADGVGSATREWVVGKVDRRWEERARWRGLFKLSDVDVDPAAEMEVHGEKGFVGWIPIGQGYGYWFSSAYEPGELDDLDTMLSYFGSWAGSPVTGVLAATPKDSILYTALFDLTEYLTCWTAGRVTLLGDAAHPMLPSMAQGACQALQDSGTLGKCFAAAASVEEALRSYEAARLPHANDAIRLSRLGDRSEGSFEDVGKVEDQDAVNPMLPRYERVIDSAFNMAARGEQP